MQTDAWAEQRELFARHLAEEEWAKVEAYYDDVDVLGQLLVSDVPVYARSVRPLTRRMGQNSRVVLALLGASDEEIAQLVRVFVPSQ